MTRVVWLLVAVAVAFGSADACCSSAYSSFTRVMAAFSSNECDKAEALLSDSLRWTHFVPTQVTGHSPRKVTLSKAEVLGRCKAANMDWLPGPELAPGVAVPGDNASATVVTSTVMEAVPRPGNASRPCAGIFRVVSEASLGADGLVAEVREEYDVPAYATYMVKCGIPFGDAAAGPRAQLALPARARPAAVTTPQFYRALEFFGSYSDGACDKLPSLSTANFELVVGVDPSSDPTVDINGAVAQCEAQAADEVEHWLWSSTFQYNNTVTLAGTSGMAVIDPTTGRPCAVTAQEMFVAEMETSGEDALVRRILNTYDQAFPSLMLNKCHFEFF